MSIWDVIARKGHTLLEHAAKRLQFQLPTTPVPQHWFEILTRTVPLARRLSADDHDLLLRVARLLLDEVAFEGCDDLEVTEEMRVTIAATAALLVYRLPYPRFTKLVSVLVYPDAFLPVQPSFQRDVMVLEPVDLLGQAWMSGVVVLSWAGVQSDSTSTDASRNLVLHEMAHILDSEDGIFDGQPLHDDASHGHEWAAILRREFDVQRDAVDSGEDAPLDAYAATNHAEFFAVATEAFFCTPDRLRDLLPELYVQLSRFFRQGLAAGS
jgi:Mlc titration factor MtfA (ptsG expression regulator)